MGTLPIRKFVGELPAGHVICRKLVGGYLRIAEDGVEFVEEPAILEFPGLPLTARQMELVKVARAKKQARLAIAKYRRSGETNKKVEKRIRQYQEALRDVEAG